MPPLTVKFSVEFECNPPVGNMPAIIFSHWLPTRDDQAICIKDDDIMIKFYFELSSAWWASQPSLGELEKYENVEARYINVELQMPDVSVELASYMENRSFKRLPTKEEEGLQTAYFELGKTIFSKVVFWLNRLVSYIRAKKGQYWLTNFRTDEHCMHKFFVQGKAQGRINDGDWFRFQPTIGDFIVIDMENHSKYVTEAEWSECRNFLLGNKKVNLVEELLVGAEYLLAADQTRSAIPEAVTALEVAANAFAQNPADEAFTERLKNRIDGQSLKSQVKHIGFSGSINYLFPVIIGEDILPTAVLRDCQAAILCRQTIVHNGQRTVDKRTARKYVKSIRKYCEILGRLTRKNED